MGHITTSDILVGYAIDFRNIWADSEVAEPFSTNGKWSILTAKASVLHFRTPVNKCTL